MNCEKLAFNILFTELASFYIFFKASSKKHTATKQK